VGSDGGAMFSRRVLVGAVGLAALVALLLPGLPARYSVLSKCVAPECAALDAPGEWVNLESGLRVTFYGPHYTGGEVTASGIRYTPNGDIVALGPDLLAQVRAHYAAEAEALGCPLWWRWAPGPKLRFGGIAGGYPWHRCFICKPTWWGYFVRVCAAGHCELLRLADTGSPALEVDLPDRTWERFGYPSSRGVFTGTLEVLSFEF
jgi:hypothetical protein